MKRGACPRQVHLLAAAATMEAHAPRLAQLCAPRAGKVYHYYCADDEALASGRQEVGRRWAVRKEGSKGSKEVRQVRK